jgi:hypothetical protein
MSKLSVAATEWIGERQPLGVAIGLFGYSMVLLLCALVADTWEFTNPAGQSVGYAQTLTWAWGFSVVVPWAAFFLVWAGREADALPGRLAGAGLLLDKDLSVPANAPQQAAARWTTIRRQQSGWWLLVTVVGLLESIGEWLVTFCTAAGPGRVAAGRRDRLVGEASGRPGGASLGQRRVLPVRVPAASGHDFPHRLPGVSGPCHLRLRRRSSAPRESPTALPEPPALRRRPQAGLRGAGAVLRELSARQPVDLRAALSKSYVERFLAPGPRRQVRERLGIDPGPAGDRS